MTETRQQILAELRRLKPGLAQRYGVTRLALFGSVARDNANSDSDIDVVVAMTKPDLFALVHIREELEADLSIKVDVIHYRESMNPFLKARIHAEALDV